MTRPTATGLSLLRTALLATAAGLLPALALAQTRVGVTSATDGDPLGKPPAPTSACCESASTFRPTS